MLAVISTSKLQLYEIILDDELDDRELLSIFINKYVFRIMYESQRDEDDFTGISSNQYESKVFYNDQNDYWKGMLIHMYHANFTTIDNDKKFTCYLRIYSK